MNSAIRPAFFGPLGHTFRSAARQHNMVARVAPRVISSVGRLRMETARVFRLSTVEREATRPCQGRWAVRVSIRVTWVAEKLSSLMRWSRAWPADVSTWSPS